MQGNMVRWMIGRAARRASAARQGARRAARVWALVLVLAVGVGPVAVGPLTGCARVPGTDRRQLVLLPRAQEIQFGQMAYDDFMAAHEDQVVRSGPEAEMIERVGRRIVAAAEPMLIERGFADLEWEFTLVDSEIVNAFVVPGGKVVFYRGILPICANEDGVAAVMGHEVGHVIARHGAERISQMLLIELTLAGVEAAWRRGDPHTRETVIGALGMGAGLGIVLPYSRHHESEADRIGVFLAADAGYDPREAVGVWERMAEAFPDRPPEFLGTHPDPARRMRDLERLMPEAMARYEAARAR